MRSRASLSSPSLRSLPTDSSTRRSFSSLRRSSASAIFLRFSSESRLTRSTCTLKEIISSEMPAMSRLNLSFSASALSQRYM